MLIIGRSVGEVIYLTVGNDTITLTLVDGKRHTRIGIDAPQSVKVMRGELVHGYKERPVRS